MIILDIVKEKIEKEGHILLYLVNYGSRLYGTATETSDEDFRGIFLPSKRSCLLGKAPHHYTWEKDYDIQLWSLQTFFKMLERGDTNSLDVLFSYTNREAVIYKNPLFDLSEHINELFDINKCSGFIGYCQNQAKSFGIKTERYKVIHNIYEYLCRLQQHQLYDPKDYLDGYVDRIVEEGQNENLCYIKFSDDNRYTFLHLGQSLHELGITMGEFCKRITVENNRYGRRTVKAHENDGVDWKALSHSVRAIFEMSELVATGKITFPLVSAEIITRIKQGLVLFEIVEGIIQKGLEEFYPGKKYDLPQKYNRKTVEHLIINSYL